MVGPEGTPTRGIRPRQQMVLASVSPCGEGDYAFGGGGSGADVRSLGAALGAAIVLALPKPSVSSAVRSTTNAAAQPFIALHAVWDEG